LAGAWEAFGGICGEREVERLEEGQGGQERIMGQITEILSNCSFSWEKLREMKDNKIEFWAADGLNKLQIFEIDEKEKRFYVVNQSGKRTWPFKYQKLEELHNKFHNGEITLLSYEIDKLVPTWGNYIVGLFKYLGCDK
jgi:hypothetical protein